MTGLVSQYGHDVFCGYTAVRDARSVGRETRSFADAQDDKREIRNAIENSLVAKKRSFADAQDDKKGRIRLTWGEG